ncbi:hypothetical protein SGLAM104S_09292 [Streptomyces glaucescens]
MWQWDRMIREDGVVRFPMPESYCDAIHEKDIAAAGVAALTEPGHEGKAYFLTARSRSPSAARPNSSARRSAARSASRRSASRRRGSS